MHCERCDEHDYDERDGKPACGQADDKRQAPDQFGSDAKRGQQPGKW